MHIENKRLLAGLQESVNGLAALSDTAQAKTFSAAAAAILSELLRRENTQQLCDNYAVGCAKAKQLAAVMNAPDGAGARQLAALPAKMDANLSVEAGYALLESLRAALTQLITDSRYPVGKGAAIDDAVLALFEWGVGSQQAAATITGSEENTLDIQALLEQSTRSQGGAFSNARVTRCLPLQGGFGNNTTLFEVEDGNRETWHLVSRAKQEINLLGLPGQDIGKEFHLVSYAYRQGIRVAEPLWFENGDNAQGLRFFVSRQVSGRNLGTAVSSEPLSDAQVKSLANGIAAIHRLPLDAADADLQRGPLNVASAQRTLPEVVAEYLRFWEGLWRNTGAGAYPLMESTFKWLHASIPQPDDVPVFLHGDYGLHNILIEGDEVSGILDWEMSHIGDRAEDISWLLSTMSNPAVQAQFMGHYLAAGGRPVSQFQLKFYEVLVHLKMMIVTIESQIRFQTLPHAGPHFCILGLNFIQHPLASLEGAIRAAEAARQ